MGAFCEVFGESSRLKVIEYFLEGHRIDLPLGMIPEETGLSRATAYQICDELLKHKIIVPTRKVANAQLYTLNKKMPEVQVLIKAFYLVLRMVAEPYLKKEVVVSH